MPDIDDIIVGVGMKLRSAAKKGGAAGSPEKAAWEKRVLGVQIDMDESDFIALLKQADQNVRNELQRITLSSKLLVNTKRTKDISDLRAEASRLQSWAQSEPLVKDLDENPIKPTSFRKMIADTTSAVLKIK
jgi:hypothetical protein